MAECSMHVCDTGQSGDRTEVTSLRPKGTSPVEEEITLPLPQVQCARLTLASTEKHVQFVGVRAHVICVQPFSPQSLLPLAHARTRVHVLLLWLCQRERVCVLCPSVCVSALLAVSLFLGRGVLSRCWNLVLPVSLRSQSCHTCPDKALPNSPNCLYVCTVPALSCLS